MFTVKEHGAAGEWRKSEMSERKIKALHELATIIRQNSQKVEQKIAASSRHRPDSPVVLTASKYRSALERLAKE
jgi:death-on-curing family protein